MTTNARAIAWFVAMALACGATARATCGAAGSAGYEDIDRILLIRCQVNTSTYPCFRASLDLEKEQVARGDINAVMGTGLRGIYTLKQSSPSFYQILIVLLRESDFLKMNLPPYTSTVVDAPLNILAVRRCGTVTAIVSRDPIEDAAHADLNSLLDRLQAAILSEAWTQTSPAFLHEFGRWYDLKTKPSDFMAP